MTNRSLAEAYLAKAWIRLKTLALLRDEGAHSDVVREAQELVELAFYGDLDFIPTTEYSVADAATAYEEAAWILALAHEVIAQRSGRGAGQ